MSEPATWVPIAGTLVTGSRDAPRLLGGRCADCGAVAFPQQPGCARCASQSIESVPLPRRGTVWTWTSQDFLPKSPPYAGPEDAESFRPWYVGFVELDEGLHVEGRFTGIDDRTPVIGEEVELVLVPFGSDEEGNQVMIYAFTPVDGGSKDG